MAAGRNPYADYLAKVPLFAAASKKDLETLAKASDEAEVPTGKELVKQGETGRHFYLIVEGTAGVWRNGQKIATLGGGGHFGELSLLDRGPRSATVVAETPLRILALGQREFAAVLEELPGLSRQLLYSMAKRLRDADTKLYSH